MAATRRAAVRRRQARLRALKGMEKKRLHAAVCAIEPPRWCPLRCSPFGVYLFERGEPEKGFPKGEN